MIPLLSFFLFFFFVFCFVFLMMNAISCVEILKRVMEESRFILFELSSWMN